MKITFQKESKHIKSPARAHDSDSGWDLFSPVKFALKPGERITMPSGVRFKIHTPFLVRLMRFLGVPLLVEAQVRPKSGRSKAGVEVSLGTIDNEYTGVTGLSIHNHTNKKISFAEGEKLAQIVFCLVFAGKSFVLKEGKVDTASARGEKGFGSTGVK